MEILTCFDLIKPQDALRAIEGGAIKTLNVGSMAPQLVKPWLAMLSMDKDDVATFGNRDLGVEFDVRKCLNDSKKDLFDLINKTDVQ